MRIRNTDIKSLKGKGNNYACIVEANPNHSADIFDRRRVGLLLSIVLDLGFLALPFKLLIKSPLLNASLEHHAAGLTVTVTCDMWLSEGKMLGGKGREREEVGYIDAPKSTKGPGLLH